MHFPHPCFSISLQLALTDCPRPQIEATAKINGLEVTLAPDFVSRQTNQSDALKAKFHNTSVPALETTNGTIALSDSDAITRFIAEAVIPGATTQLLGGGKDCPVARANVHQWIGFASDVLHVCYWGGLPRLGLAKYDADTEKFVLDVLRSKLSILNGWLEAKEKEGKWVVGTEKLSLADISLATSLMAPFQIQCDEEFCKGIPAVMAYFHRVREAEQIKGVFDGPLPFLSKLEPMQ